MGLTMKMRREMVQVERDVIRNLLADQKRIRAAIKQSRLNIEMHQDVLRGERTMARIARENRRAVRRQNQIAKMEAKLAALKAAA